MPKKDRHCGNKIRHATAAAANAHRSKITYTGNNVYKCTCCGFWHVGRSRSGTSAADRIGVLLKKYEVRLEARLRNGVTALVSPDIPPQPET